jgi:para-aminobenzoate synthetase/4-amino-4-deoxychorismate lyase
VAYILLENRKTADNQANSHYFYGDSTRISCTQPEQVKTCLQKIEEARQLGRYLVGYISYEASYCLNPSIVSSYQNEFNRPLVDFYQFDKHELLTQAEVDVLLKKMAKKYAHNEAFIYNIGLNFDLASYTAQLEKIKKHIKDGETYQVNLTGKYKFQFQGAPIQLYRLLRDRQKVEFSAVFNCEQVQLLSFSPELFFEKRAAHFRAKPMKGTMPRSMDSIIDASNQARLTQDPKIIAENMMIVDLLRNDLSVIAQPGSVNVPKLFEVEKYETLYQMTSTVSCKVDKNIAFGDIMTAIFPCGSITGAPKVRTMQIINALEKQDRGIYTGAIGYITPQNDMCFNVAIRTLDLSHQRGEMGVGGGIIDDSIAQDEFEEIKTKARFLTELATPFNLLECFLYDAKLGFRYIDDHLERLHKSAITFNFSFSKQAIFEKLITLQKELDPAYQYKIKLVLQKNGVFDISSIKIKPGTKSHKIKVLNDRIKTAANVLFQHKTDAKTVRGFYDQSLAQANLHAQLFDVVFTNEQGFITEGSKSNIFISKKGEISTPAITCGVLPGVMRHKFIAQHPHTKETLITKQDLIAADIIWMSNSVVGIVQVTLI